MDIALFIPLPTQQNFYFVAFVPWVVQYSSIKIGRLSYLNCFGVLQSFPEFVIELPQFFFRIKCGDVILVRHQRRQRIRRPLTDLQIPAVFLEHCIVIHLIIFVIPATNKRTIMMRSVHRQRVAIKCDHICPNLKYIGFVGVVIHIRRCATGWTHIHFQSNHITLIAKTILIFCQHKEFQMHESAADTVLCNNALACVLHFRIDFFL